jgi:hypothetical protein
MNWSLSNIPIYRNLVNVVGEMEECQKLFKKIPKVFKTETGEFEI